MNFTLGLSGWTNNDWSRAGNFDLLAPRLAVDDLIKKKVFTALQQDWFSTSEQLAGKLNLENAQVAGALSAYTQAGRVVYDLNRKVYRLRELSREPLPFEQLRFNNPNEEQAAKLVAEQKGIEYQVDFLLPDNSTKLSGSVKANRRVYKPELVIDADERIKSASCDCNFYTTNKLYKGPCEHMLAIRQLYSKTRFANIS